MLLYVYPQHNELYYYVPFLQTGNAAMSAQTSAELFSIYKKNGCNPYKMALTPLIQLPVFISFFVAIRQMAAVPVESMKTGGLYWFTDLTVPDPYYLLPFMGCAAFIAIIEVTRTVYHIHGYWWELNLAAGPKIAITKMLVDVNLAVQ